MINDERIEKGIIKLIDGELYYHNQYCYWLYKQLEKAQTRIDKSIKYCEDIIEQQIDNNDDDFSQGEDFTAREIYKILKGSEEDEN